MPFNLFKRKPALPPVNLSVLKTDMHSHLIPGIDDGTKTLDESVKLIRKMQELGYQKLITTPHIQYDYFKNNNDIITDGLAKLQQTIAQEGLNIQIEAAAEYLIDDGFEDKMKAGQLMTFGDKYLLVELSYYNMNSRFFEHVFDLNIEGYKVILAHPERYGYFHDNFSIYEDLKERGVFLQINIISLSGFYSEQVRKITEKLIDANLVDFVGSDMHNFIYYENFIRALNSEHLHKLFDSGVLKNHLL